MPLGDEAFFELQLSFTDEQRLLRLLTSYPLVRTWTASHSRL